MDSNGQFLVSLIKTDQIWHKQWNFIERNLIAIEYIKTRYNIKKYWILWFPKNIFWWLVTLVSTLNQYQGIWFLLYLDSQKVLHHSINVCHVIDFLSYFSENCNLAYKTITVYKNALRLPLLFGLSMNLDYPLVTHLYVGFTLLNCLLLMALCLLGTCLICYFCSL